MYKQNEPNLPNLALITPYQNLSHGVSQQSLGQFNCHVFHGSLDIAAQIAQTLNPDIYDVILSRGGTADFIDKTTEIPVVRIITTALDLLRSIMPYKNQVTKIAYFNFGSYLPSVEEIAQAMGIKIDEYIFHNSQDIENNIDICKKKKYDLIIGGTPVYFAAKRNNLKAALIENGTESIDNALREAKAIIETKQRQYNYLARLESILSSINEGIIVTDERNTILIFNKAAERIFNLTASNAIGKQVDLIVKNTRINQVLLNRSPEIGELQDIGNTLIITSRIPIFNANKCIGVVCSFSETPQIQKAERIIRGKLVKKGFNAKYKFDDIQTQDKNLKKIISLAKIYSRTVAPILLYGESGTGKELFAQSIHLASQCNKGPFVAINCAAIPENLLESELFGYEGGAFTGAKKDGKEGLIELAHNGTLFLDEVGELPKLLQSRLLRVLQEYEIMRIGGKDVIPINIRIISATNRNLEKMCAENLFRTDLFHRLNVLPLTLPPLRERKGDILYLAKSFLKKQQDLPKLDQFLDNFKYYQWKGNVRELKQLIDRLSLLSDSFPNLNWIEILELTGFALNKVVTENCSDFSLIIDIEKGNLKQIIQNMENKIIKYYMDVYRQDQNKVIKKLGISKMSLWRKLNNIT